MRLLRNALCVVLSTLAWPAFADGNTVQVINHAVAAFEKRFEMIDHATKSIDVEYFIYNTDQAGRIFSQALIRKKQEHPEIQIRVIVDASATVLQLKDAYVSAFRDHGIEVRYYNTASLVTHFKTAQFRDHRKLLSIDGKEAITGSRNIADEYFDLSPDFNFRDRDIWVQGPIVADMERDFDAYWTNSITVPGPLLGKLDSKKKVQAARKAADFLAENRDDRYIREQVRKVGTANLNDPRSMGACQSLSYVTDVPGIQVKATPQSPGTRRVLPKLMSRLIQMSPTDANGKIQKLYVESPYFIIKDQEAKDELSRLKNNGIQSVLLTNSLASTDAFYVAANFYPKISFYQELSNSEMYIFEGKLPLYTDFVETRDGDNLAENAVWGIHSKTLVFGEEGFTIGTFNIDPRSANLNSEMMVFCEGNKELSQYVADDIRARIEQSDRLNEDGSLVGGKTLFDNVSYWKKLKFKAAKLPSEWFSYLL